ncbi:MAG: hypothetical protein GY851_04090, partial [bacterium]|nr:hypothetical protein [bacterium]
VSLLPWHGSRYSFAGKTGYAIHTFDIDAPGTYVLSAGVPVKPGQTEVVLSLKRGFGARMLVVILVPLGVVFAGVAVMLAVLGLFPGRGRANGHGLVETNGDGVLLDTSRGFFEGSWRMPLAYEGSLCDRYFGGRVGGRIQCNARLTLTEDAIHIVPWFGDPVTIPLDRVYDTYPCSTTGGKIWARDRVLKIVWQSDEGVAATGVVTMLGAGTNARDWSDAIAPLLSGLPAPDADAVESVRRVNRRVTRIFWGVALSPVLLEVAAFAGWVPISMGLLTNAFLPSFLIAALVARAYYRRHARAVDTIRG